MQTADWQLLFSDRFTGARNPARLPTKDAIPSNPLRPPFTLKFTTGAKCGCGKTLTLAGNTIQACYAVLGSVPAAFVSGLQKLIQQSMSWDLTRFRSGEQAPATAMEKP